MSQDPLHRGTSLVLTVEGVDKSFDGFKAVNDLNFYLREGELHTVIGPNGAGKSTFMDLITARTKPDRGKIVYHKEDGHDIDLTRTREHVVSQLGISRKFQNPTVYNSHTVYDNLLLSLNAGRGVLKTLFYRETREHRDKIHQVLETIRLESRKNHIAGSLSHGQKQWLEIGMLLIQDPELLMLDEPVAGMSVAERKKTAELLHRIIQDRSVIVIEHDMGFVEDIAHKVTVLHQGKILSEGPMAKVKSDPKVVEVYLGH